MADKRLSMGYYGPERYGAIAWEGERRSCSTCKGTGETWVLARMDRRPVPPEGVEQINCIDCDGSGCIVIPSKLPEGWPNVAPEPFSP